MGGTGEQEQTAEWQQVAKAVVRARALLETLTKDRAACNAAAACGAVWMQSCCPAGRAPASALERCRCKMRCLLQEKRSKHSSSFTKKLQDSSKQSVVVPFFCTIKWLFKPPD